MTRVCVTLVILYGLLLTPTLSQADDYVAPGGESLENVAPDSPTREYEAQLQRERYKTALARERAEQAYQEDRARHYEYQAQIRNSSVQRVEQEREYDRQRDDINTISQTANTIASIVRQAQVIHSWGW